MNHIPDYEEKQFTFSIKIAATLMLIVLIILTLVYVACLGFKKKDTTPSLSTNVEKQPSEAYSASLENLYFEGHTSNQQIGRSEAIIDYKENIFYSIHYPVFGNSTIDNILTGEVMSTLSSFINEFSNYVAADESQRAFLNIEYESYLVGDSIASVIYYIKYDSPTYTNPIQEIKTHVFLLATNEEILPEKIFSGGFLQLFSDKTKAFLSANPNYVNSLTAEEYTKNYSPNSPNFTDYIMTSEGITLYFDPYTIAPGEYGCLSFSIPKDEILPYMIFDPFIQVNLPTEPLEQAVANNASFTIDPSKPMIALTFDDGPHTEITNRILNVLEAYNSHATFFVVGNRLKNARTTVERTYALGCEIGNHSYSHAKFTSGNKKLITSEIEKTNEALKSIIGVGTSLVRTPGGRRTDNILKHIKYPVILWNIDTRDWDSRNKEKIVKKVLGKVKDGDIVLMHDLYESTAEAVEIIVPELINQGYQLVTVSELFAAKQQKLKKGKVYGSAD